LSGITQTKLTENEKNAPSAANGKLQTHYFLIVRLLQKTNFILNVKNVAPPATKNRKE
jgi:hypothetical protein